MFNFYLYFSSQSIHKFAWQCEKDVGFLENSLFEKANMYSGKILKENFSAF